MVQTVGAPCDMRNCVTPWRTPGKGHNKGTNLPSHTVMILPATTMYLSQSVSTCRVFGGPGNS